MRNDLIRQDIKTISSITKTAKAIGCTKQTLRNKLDGICPWKMTEILSLSRHFRWTVEQFLTIIEYNKAEE